MTRLWSVVVDAADPIAQARWWGDALGVPVTGDGETAWLEPVGAPLLEFVPVPEPKSGKNRIHLDLATYVPGEHAALADRLLTAGATRIDVGQPADADWVVLADPEGNEFCVVEPRPANGYEGPIACISCDTAETEATGAFWITASSWTPVRHAPEWTLLRAPDGKGPYLGLYGEREPKTAKNRIHLDVAPLPGADHAAEVDALVAAGARPIDIGQGDVPWVVLADPGGNELCVLTPR